MFSTRKQRGINQKLYLIETCAYDPVVLSRSYVIMGSTGNAYTVTISNIPKCTCPDHTLNNNRCKHIYFVLIRVMMYQSVDKSIYTDNDLTQMFINIPQITNSIHADKNIVDKYHELNKLNNEQIDSHNNLDKDKLDDLCPICLDDLENGEEIDYCKYSCNKVVHKECFNIFQIKNGSYCLYCKKPWTKNSDNGVYINLSKVK